MGAKPGRKFYTRMRTPVALMSPSIHKIPTYFLPPYGRRSEHHGACQTAVQAAALSLDRRRHNLETPRGAWSAQGPVRKDRGCSRGELRARICTYSSAKS